MTEFKPVFRMAWSGVDTECEECGRSISASDWFYRAKDENDALKRLCSRCKKKTGD